jgi:hypothetical protein
VLGGEYLGIFLVKNLSDNTVVTYVLDNLVNGNAADWYNGYLAQVRQIGKKEQ